MASLPARHASGGVPCLPPNREEQRLLDLLENAPPARLAAIVKCIPGWQFEGQANLGHWGKVLDKLKAQLTAALRNCPRLVVAAAPEGVVAYADRAEEDEETKEDGDVAMGEEDEQQLTDHVIEALRFMAILLENASNKHLFNATECVVTLMGARNDRVAFEATHVVAALALPPQQHRHAVDPTTVHSESPASGNAALRRRLLALAQGRGSNGRDLEDLCDQWSDTPVPVANVNLLEGTSVYQFYQVTSSGSEDLVSVKLDQHLTTQITSAATDTEASFQSSCLSGNICEHLVETFAVPPAHQFQLLVRIRSVVATITRRRASHAQESAAVERLHALVALFYLFSDSLDVANLVEQNAGLARNLTELVRAEKSDEVPLRVRVVTLQVIAALVYDRAERGGTGGILGRQSNVLQALGVAKGAPHGVFPSLVRYAMSELGQIVPKIIVPSGVVNAAEAAAKTTETDNDMDMSLAVAFVQATTDLITPEEAEVLRAGLFRDPLHPQDRQLCWIEAVLVLLNHVVSMQTGATILTESGVVPALLHVASSPATSAFHMSLITLCIQALETTVNTHTAAAALYRDLNGVGIIVDRLQTEIFSGSDPTETKTVLIIALLVMLSVSFHSQGVMSAGATSRVIRDGSPLSKALIRVLSSIDTFGPVVFAQAAIVVSDIVNNDPTSVNQVHSGGIAEAFLKTLTRWNVAEFHSANILPPSSELIMAIPSVLSALCLTSAHAEKVARYKPLLYLLDCFATPAYVDEDYDHLQGDVAAIVGSGVFEMMRQVSSFQTAAIQASVEAAKKMIRFGEESQPSSNSEPNDGNYKTLLRMATHFGDVLEPILSKSEHASSFADHGGVQCLLKIYRVILPTAPMFLSSLLLARGGKANQHQRMTHQPAAQSVTLALRSFASQQPAKMLSAVMVELNRQIGEFCGSCGDIDGLFSSLPDVELAQLFGESEGSLPVNLTQREAESSKKLQTTSQHLRHLAYIEWLVGLLEWTMQAAQNGLQSRHWFSELLSRTNVTTLEKLFSICRSIQLERAALTGAHRKSDPQVPAVNDQADGDVTSKKMKGLWKLCSLLLLRFTSVTRSLLVTMSKTLLSIPIQHRRGDDTVHPLAAHAQTAARFVAKMLREHIKFVVSKDDSRPNRHDPFVKKYYLIFVLETIMQTVFDSKKKQANSLVLYKLVMPDSATTDSASAYSCVHDLIAFLTEDCFETTECIDDGASSRMVELCVRVGANALQHLGDLETLRTSQITISLVTNDEASTSEERDRFDLRKLSVQLHRECLHHVVRLWEHPQVRASPIHQFAQELLPAVVMILRHRLDLENAQISASNPISSFDQLRSRNRHDIGTTFGDFPGAGSVLDREDFLQALFGAGGGGRVPSRSTITRPFEVDSATVDSLTAMGFPRGQVERAIRRVRVNDVEVAMEWLLSHPDADEEDDQEVEDENEQTSTVGTSRDEGTTVPDGAGSTTANEPRQSEDELSLYQGYESLREGFEGGCFEILRHQTSEAAVIASQDMPSSTLVVQAFVPTLAQYMALLCSKVDDERQKVISRIGGELMRAVAVKDDSDRYVMAIGHLLAVILQLDAGSVDALVGKVPGCVDAIVSHLQRETADATKTNESAAPLLLLIDAVQTSDLSATQSLNEFAALDQAPSTPRTTKLSIGVRSELVRLGVAMMQSPELQRSTAHALWQLLVRITLDYDVASELYALGGVERLLNLREKAVFVGYKEMTAAILVQMLESPQVLEQMMEEKIIQAMAKLAERYGPPTQMRITPRVLMMEVASVASRSEKIFVEALKKAVVFKKTESGRVYVLLRAQPVDQVAPTSAPTPAGNQHDEHHHAEKKVHKLPKSHRQHAQTVVHKLVEKIYEVWETEKHLRETRSIQDEDETRCEDSLLLGIGVYTHLLVQVVSTFPACAVVLTKAHQSHVATVGVDPRDNIIHLSLRELLPCKTLCRFSAVRRSFEANSGVDGISNVSRVREALTLRTRERMKSVHKLLVAIGTQPGDGPKVIVGELVKLFQEWPQCVSSSHSAGAELSVDDEVALSALHAWSALIMCILWPRGTASKTLSWDKIVLGGGLTGKYAFVTLLVDALRKISLSHPFAYSACTMLLRPLTTLTRPFVTHRVKKLLMKRTSPSTETNADAGHTASGSGSNLSSEIVATSSMTPLGQVEDSPLGPTMHDDQDDVTMRSPTSTADHEMRDAGAEPSDDESERSSMSGRSVDDEERQRHHHDEADDDEDDEEDDDDDEDEDEDEDEDASDDEEQDEGDDEDEEMDEEEGRIRLRMVRRNQDGSSRSRGTGRTWGSLDNEGGDGFDEVDEEEFSYLRLLEDEAIVSNQARAAQLRVSARSRAIRDGDRAGVSVPSGVDHQLRSLVDMFSVDGGQNESQVGVFAFGDDDDDEDDPDMAFRHGGGALRDHLALPNDTAAASSNDMGNVGTALFNMLEDRTNGADDNDFIFQTVDTNGAGGAGVAATRRLAAREQTSDSLTSASGLLHPLLRQSGPTSDAPAGRGAGGMAGLLPDRIHLPRHAPSLFRELNVLVRQMNNNMHLAPGARTLLGRDLLRHGGGRNRPPSRSRLSAVSNLLSEFSLDIPTSQGVFGHGRAGNRGGAIRRGERDLLGGGRSLRGDMGMEATPTWGGNVGSTDARSIATRLEQVANRLVEPETSPPDPVNASATTQQRQSAPAPSSEEIRNEDADETPSDLPSITAVVNPDNISSTVDQAGHDTHGDTPDQAHGNEAASDTASVVALASTLGESSLRSPHDDLSSETEMSPSPVLSATSRDPMTVQPAEHAGIPPPAPVSGTSSDLMNFTLDLSSFQQSPSTSAALAPAPPPTEHRGAVVEEEMKNADEVEQGNVNALECPEGVDPEVFAFLPPEMQAEIVAQHASPAAQPPASNATAGGSESFSQLDLDMANSSFDRETLEALPPDIRAEVLANERREREAAAQAAEAPADISRAEEMDNASFVASLAPGLREEILTTCDDAFLQTLPSQVQAEAMVLRERAAYRPVFQQTDTHRGTGHGTADDETTGDIFRRPTLRRMLTSNGPDIFSAAARRSGRTHGSRGRGRDDSSGANASGKSGMVRVVKDEEEGESDRILEDCSIRALLRLLFMAQSVVQNRVFQRLITNVCLYPLTRESVRVNLLRILSSGKSTPMIKPASIVEEEFPPKLLYGTSNCPSSWILGSGVPPEVIGRVLSVMLALARQNTRFAVDMLLHHDMASGGTQSGAEILVDLLELPIVSRSAILLETTLELIELVLSPLDRYEPPASKTREEEEEKKDEEPAATGSDWVLVPEVNLDATRLAGIARVLALNICSPSMQERTIQILKLLDRVPTNRPRIMDALVRDARNLVAAARFRSTSSTLSSFESSAVLKSAQDELKLLRILHTLSDVCETTSDFNDCCAAIGLDALWAALSKSLDEARVGSTSVVDTGAEAKMSGASGVVSTERSGEEAEVEGMVIEGKSAGASIAMAALLARFLPMVEAFFVVSARDAASMPLRVPDSAEREEAMVTALREGGLDGVEQSRLELKRLPSTSSATDSSDSIRLANFVEANRVLLNLLVREKPSLLDSSLAALVKLPRCRAYLDFDNKRTYFQSAMKKLRQTALRSQVGNAAVRLSVRRDHIFEDSYYALRMRSGAELRRKLHIAFTGEEGIDAGGVTREWYVILAREIFNPNYVLFTSAADSPTFQPNPLSYVNKDHLSYFEFVGKVIGKAVADGQLLDAHFTRSFYKHILQLPISYHDMEAIDPEYYRNLHSILDNAIEELGLELTFSADQSNFGRMEIVDLIPNGRHIAVTDENKMEYVKLVTHHRMATGIRQQIDAFLKGFHQLVPPEMISIFNENELELLISGMPEIDIDDLKANTDYANYKPTDAVIRWFWNVLYSCTHEERALFLQFVTGTSKVPLEGFKALEGMRGTHKFNIHKAFGNPNALPSAHTCFNQLDLPEYESEEKLRQCLLLAIREGSEGFGFG